MNKIYNIKKLSAFILTVCAGQIFFCSTIPEIPANKLDLSGIWQVRLIADDHLSPELNSGVVHLPGTLDENHIGYVNRDSTDMHLNRIYTYTGPAVFKKEIEIPGSWEGKRIELVMERTKVTHVWLDSLDLGTDNTLFSPQVYDLTGTAPGPHTLTIQVDNNPELVPVMGSHACSEDTQTNWHGILGDFYLKATNPVRMRHIRVYTDIHKKEITVRIGIQNPGYTLSNARIELKVEARNRREKTVQLKKITSDTVLTIPYSMGEDVQLWSEYDPALYKLKVSLLDSMTVLDRQSVTFGMREFSTQGTQFAINGLTTMLRGKHEACVFPLTGYPPMEKEGWIRVFRIAQEYGLNHYRYHSWCPPEAAFEAADICGIYLQPELPIWWSFKANDPAQMAFMMKEGFRIMDAYGNHPSFVMFALGNEIWQERDSLKQMIASFRSYDNRRLYAQGSNNRGGDPSQAEGDDFWVTFRTAREKEDCSMDVRSSIAFLDSKEGGILNTLPPRTDRTYETAIAVSTIPVIGHEIGQYQVYPNYETELPRYKGILKPWNLMLFRDRLEKKGMGDQVRDFFRASGALSMLCYREDIETAIRTPGFGGFQLLDLQDFPGQGTALVGVLDAFMDSKGLITPDEFRQFCDEVILIAEMKKRIWENNDIFSANVVIANYSAAPMDQVSISWEMLQSDGRILENGTLDDVMASQGGLTEAGQVKIDLSDIHAAQKVMLHLKMNGSDVKTAYPVWIYPAGLKPSVPSDVLITSALTPEAVNQLNRGGKVLLFPDLQAVEKNSVGGQFIAEFWNYGMFTMLAEQWGGQKSHGTMGILTNPEHPLFQDFPTECHTNWQWWPIIKAGRPIILDDTDPVYRPLVQVIDNINRNYKLGLIFEYRVGSGKILVCSVDLPSIQEEPQARQLMYSILKYMDSNDYNPEAEIDVEKLDSILFSEQ